MSFTSSPDFDAIAPVYDALAQLVYGKAQKRAQAHFLSSIPNGARILVLGGGSGWILPELLRQSNPSYVLFLEASRKMLQRARERTLPASAEAKIDFREGTEISLLPQERFHVVLTPFVLDLFPAPAALALMQRLDQAFFPNGLWLHTDFQLSASPARQIWQKPMLWAMYRFFHFVSKVPAIGLPPLPTLFESLHYELQREASFYGDFIRAQVWQKRENW